MNAIEQQAYLELSKSQLGVAIPDFELGEEPANRLAEFESGFVTQAGKSLVAHFFLERILENRNLVDLKIEAFDRELPPGKQYAANFHSALQYGKQAAAGKDPQKFWLVFNRHVEKDYRHQGIAELFLRLTEEVALKLGHKYPNLKADWLEINTGLSSTTKLIIDQNWLKANDMWEFLHKDGRNLGYVPDADPWQVRRILEAGTEEFAEISDPQRYFQIKLVKPWDAVEFGPAS